MQARSSLEGSRGAPGRGGQDPVRKGKSGGLTCTPGRVDYALTMQVQVRTMEVVRGSGGSWRVAREEVSLGDWALGDGRGRSTPGR